MDFDEPMSSRCSFPTSDARSEPLPPPRPPRIFQPPPGPPPPTRAFAVQISQGVWKQDGDIYHTSEWPPVQEYLALVRKSQTRPPPPSELVFTLAALHVLRTPSDRAHWMFWDPAYYIDTGKVVDSIALQTPRLIKSDVPWIGHNEYRWVVSNYEEKFHYVVINKEWYPTDSSRPRGKRSLRSNNDRQTITAKEYFNLPDEEKRPRKPARRAADAHTSPAAKRPRRAVAQPKNSLVKPTVTAVEVVETSPGVQPTQKEQSPSSNPRSSTRVRRKVTPSTPAPRIISSPNNISLSPAEPQPAILSSLPSSSSADSSSPSPAASSSHSRDRSTSSSSGETLIEEPRSSSVLSSDTVVGSSPSKKRKMEVLEAVIDSAECQEVESIPSEGMVTRGRASKRSRVEVVGDSEKSLPSSRTATPTVETRAKSSRPKAKSKRARA